MKDYKELYEAREKEIRMEEEEKLVTACRNELLEDFFDFVNRNFITGES